MQITFDMHEAEVERLRSERNEHVPMIIAMVGVVTSITQFGLAFFVGGYAVPFNIVVGAVGPLMCAAAFLMLRAGSNAIERQRAAMLDDELGRCVSAIRDHFEVEVPHQVVFDLLFLGACLADFEIDVDGVPTRYAARYDGQQFTLFLWSRAEPVSPS